LAKYAQTTTHSSKGGRGLRKVPYCKQIEPVSMICGYNLTLGLSKVAKRPIRVTDVGSID